MDRVRKLAGKFKRKAKETRKETRVPCPNKCGTLVIEGSSRSLTAHLAYCRAAGKQTKSRKVANAIQPGPSSQMLEAPSQVLVVPQEVDAGGPSLPADEPIDFDLPMLPPESPIPPFSRATSPVPPFTRMGSPMDISRPVSSIEMGPSPTPSISVNQPHSDAVSRSDASSTRSSRRSQRTAAIPKRYNDMVPVSQTLRLRSLHRPLELHAEAMQAREAVEEDQRARRRRNPAPEEPQRSPRNPQNMIETTSNCFNLYRRFVRWPGSTGDAEHRRMLEDMTEHPGIDPDANYPPEAWGSSLPKNINSNVLRLLEWFYMSQAKTEKDLERLVYNVLLDPEFDVKDFKSFRTSGEVQKLDFATADGWKETSVKIRLPMAGKRFAKEEDAPELEIGGLLYRDIVEIIKSVYESPKSKDFTFDGCEQMWNPPGELPHQRVYCEAWTTRRYADMEDDIRAVHPTENNMNPFIIPLKWYTDATKPTMFGPHVFWPGYMWFMNQSKYIRNEPSSFSTHHFVYIPKFPADKAVDDYRERYNKPPSAATLTHLRREYIHAVYAALLNDKFKDAYDHGIVLRCGDGIQRRGFPRFFLYSEDYPEKTGTATIQFLGKKLSPDCRANKNDGAELGRPATMLRCSQFRLDSQRRRDAVEAVRRLIFNLGRVVNSKSVKEKLASYSGVPTRNAFSNFLSHTNDNFYRMFCADTLHAGDLGPGAQLLSHLFRICEKLKALDIVNDRFRQVPPFGRDTIRPFRGDTSAMTNPAARDHEDVLQCSMACFEDMVIVTGDESTQEDNEITQDFIFFLATFMALAKMRMHSDASIRVFTAVTGALGDAMRRFITVVCPKYETKELPHETAKRIRAATRAAAKRQKDGKEAAPTTLTPQAKDFNVNTYKWHILNHYPLYVPYHGPLDDSSTLPGEQEHRKVKVLYRRTNKVGFEKQIAKLENRQRVVRETGLEMRKDLAVPVVKPDKRYEVTRERRKAQSALHYEAKHKDDPAVKDFYDKLCDHVVRQLKYRNTDTNDGESLLYERKITQEERNTVNIENDKLWEHAVVRFNYTSYECRRDQDSVNPHTESNIMLLSGTYDPANGDHPYAYARIIGVFHLSAKLSQRDPFTDVDVLWVRWYAFDTASPCGWVARRLPKIGFLNPLDKEAFDFVSPEDVIRAAHIVPCYTNGLTPFPLPEKSLAWRKKDKSDEAFQYENYYVNIFADRDMFTRFCGFGIGHQMFWDETALFRDQLEQAFKIKLWGDSEENVDTNLTPRETSPVPEGAEEDTEVGSGDDSGAEDAVVDSDEDRDSSDEDYAEGREY